MEHRQSYYSAQGSCIVTQYKRRIIITARPRLLYNLLWTGNLPASFSDLQIAIKLNHYESYLIFPQNIGELRMCNCKTTMPRDTV